MHDIMERVANYVMTGLITVWIKKKYSTLKELNQAIKKFDFGDDNKPTEIKFDSETRSVEWKMSAAQMRNFVHFFECPIGHRNKKCCEKDVDAQNLFKNLKTILMSVTLPKIHQVLPHNQKVILKNSAFWT